MTMKPCVSFRYLAFLLFSFNIACQGQNKEAISSVRLPAVAGSFYPADAVALRAELADLFLAAGSPDILKNMAAVIVPHAGYVFSGKVAASAFARLDPEKEYEHIFLIGPSHYVYLDGASVCNRPGYRTPLGTVDVDTALVRRLIRSSRFLVYEPEAHVREHSIEVELPFLQYRLKHKFRIVPIIIGTRTASVCRKIAETLEPYFNDRNLFVISSDFSHYPAYEGALEADQTTGKAVESGDPDNFLKALRQNESSRIPGLVTSACGQSPILTLLYLSSENPGIRIQHIRYLNSGDTDYGDKLRVVGYHSFVFTREQKHVGTAAFSLSRGEQVRLLKIARAAIESRLQHDDLPSVNDSALTETLKTSCGAFVTLTRNGRLRGCIGRFRPTEPLYKVVQEMAVAAAFRDVRFDPVRQEEMSRIDLEISVLSPLKRISSVDEFELGKQGIYLVRGNRSGTFLPQVAMDTGWSKEEFLGHCARDKAGIGWDGWRDADLYTYEASVFSEKGLLTPKR